MVIFHYYPFSLPTKYKLYKARKHVPCSWSSVYCQQIRCLTQQVKYIQYILWEEWINSSNACWVVTYLLCATIKYFPSFPPSVSIFQVIFYRKVIKLDKRNIKVTLINLVGLSVLSFGPNWTKERIPWNFSVVRNVSLTFNFSHMEKYVCIISTCKISVYIYLLLYNKDWLLNAVSSPNF